MKNISLSIFAVFSLCLSIKAQSIEIVPLVGNVFPSTYQGYEGRIEFDNGIAYGGMLNFLPNDYVEVGLSFINQETNATFVDYYGFTIQNKSVPAGIAYYDLSCVRNFGDWQKIVPFAGVDIGAVQFYERNASSRDYWKFAFGFKGGIKFQITEMINLRIQPQLELPIQSFGLGIGIGTIVNK